MKRVTALAGCIAALLGDAAAQEVGRQLNFQSPTSPNYQPLAIPPEAPQPAFELPALPAAGEGERSISEGGRIAVSKVRVEGVTAFRPEEVQAVVAPYESREVSAGELHELRVALTRLYIDRGYVSSGVLLPDQAISDGVVVYRAVEGSLTDVAIVGSTKISDGYVRGRIDRHMDGPLNVNDLQYALRTLQQDPNVQRLDARLSPGESPGESVLRLSIDDAPRFHFGIGADNHRASSTGAERGIIYFGSRNLTGYGDEFRATGSVSDGAWEGSAVVSVPLGARGTTLQAYYSQSDADIIEDAFRILDIESETRTWGASLTIPFVDGLNSRFSLVLGAESKRSETRLLGVPFSLSPGAQDGVAETAVGLVGLDWVGRGRSSVTGMRLTYRHGFDELDATIYEPGDPLCAPINVGGQPVDPCNPTGADGEFGLVQAQFVHLQRLNGWKALSGLNDRAQFIFRTTAQLSQDPLLSMEKMAIGGVSTVRGYPENLLIRDNGVAATLELQLPLLAHRPEPHPANLVLAPFVDYGVSWDERNTDPGSNVRNTEDRRYIASAGVGLLWQPVKGLDVQVYWGADIADNFDRDDPRQFRTEDLQDDGVHFAVNYVYRW